MSTVDTSSERYLWGAAGSHQLHCFDGLPAAGNATRVIQRQRKPDLSVVPLRLRKLAKPGRSWYKVGAKKTSGRKLNEVGKQQGTLLPKTFRPTPPKDYDSSFGWACSLRLWWRRQYQHLQQFCYFKSAADVTASNQWRSGVCWRWAH
jgi:hypothetical protein